MQAAPLEGAITSLEEMRRPEHRAQFPWLLPWRSLASHTPCHLQDSARTNATGSHSARSLAAS